MAGKTVIASKIGGIEEIIKENINGYLFEPKNLSELKAKIKIAITISTHVIIFQYPLMTVAKL